MAKRRETPAEVTRLGTARPSHGDALITECAFAADGLHFASFADGEARVWSADGALVATRAGLAERALAFDGPDALQVREFEGNSFRWVFSTGDDQSPGVPDFPASPERDVSGVAASPYGPWQVALCRLSDADGTRTSRRALATWNPDTGATCFAPTRQFFEGSSPVAFHPDDQRAAIFGDFVAVYALSTGAELARYAAPNGERVEAGGFTADGQRCIGATNERLCAWQADTGELLAEVAFPRPLRPLALAVAPDGSGVFGAEGVVHRFGSDLALRSPGPGHAGAVRALAATSDGRTLASVEAGLACVWDLEAGRLLAEVRIGDGAFVALSPDGDRLLAARDAGAGAWELPGGEPSGEAALVGARAVVWSSTGVVALAADDAGVQAASGWPPTPGASVGLPFARGPVVLSADGRVAFGWSDADTWRVWRVEDGATLAERAQGPVLAAALAPDGSSLAFAAAEPRGVAVHRLAPSGSPTTLGARGAVRALAFSRDGRRLAMADDAGVTVFELANGAKSLFAEPGARFTAVAFAGPWLVAGGEDGLVRRWRSPGGG